jgi:hypothetical protein
MAPLSWAGVAPAMLVTSATITGPISESNRCH